MRRGIVAGAAALLAFVVSASAQERTRISTRLDPGFGLQGEVWADVDFRSRGDDARFTVKVRGVQPGTPLRLRVGGVEVASRTSENGCIARFPFRSDAEPVNGGTAPTGGEGGGETPPGEGNGDGDGGDGGGNGDGDGEVPFPNEFLDLRCIRSQGSFGGGGDRDPDAWMPLDFDPRGQLLEVLTPERTILSGTLGPNDAFGTRIQEVVRFEAPAGGEGGGTLRFVQKRGVRELRIDVDGVEDGELRVFVNGTERGVLPVSRGRGRAKFSNEKEAGDGGMDLGDLGGPVELRRGGAVLLAAAVTPGADDGTDGAPGEGDPDGGGTDGGGPAALR